MKKNFLFILIFFFNFFAFSQEKFLLKNKNYLQFNFGLAYPSGNFAKKDFFNKKHGFALRGFSTDIDIVHFFITNLGMNIRISAIGNSLDLGKIGELYLKEYGTKIEFVKGNYDFISLTTGLIFEKELLKDLFLSTKILSGVLFAYQDELIIKTKIQINDSTFVKEPILFNKKSSSVDLPFILNMGLRYKINSKIGISINCDYFSSSAKFNVNNEKTKIDIKMFKINIGISYNY